MRWDSRGRLWVACSTTYPHVYPGNEPNDKLVILEDTDGDGKADKSSVFADDLHIPLSFEFGDGGVYVSEMPELTFIKDTDGDGKADFDAAFSLDLEPKIHITRCTIRLDARWRFDLSRIGFSSFASRNSIRASATTKQRLVPLSAKRPEANQFRNLLEHESVGCYVRRLGATRRQSPDLRCGVSRVGSSLSSTASKAQWPASLFGYLRTGICGFQNFSR